MYLIFDTETTGLPLRKNAPIKEVDNWPRLVQIAWQVHDAFGNLKSHGNKIIKPEGYTIPFNAQKIHGISTERALLEGDSLKSVLDAFTHDLKYIKVLVGHNIDFDNKIVGAEFYRCNSRNLLADFPTIDTCFQTKEFTQLKGGIGGRLKAPKLIELYEKLFEKSFGDAHDAAYDVDATAKSFFECLRRGILEPFEPTPKANIKYQAPKLEKANSPAIEVEDKVIKTEENKVLINSEFTHLHVHSQFSVLQATPELDAIFEKASSLKMGAVAITDLSNLFGAFKFVRLAKKYGIKPIIGCEFYVAKERKKTQFTKDSPDKRFQQVLLAKNSKGYQNLVKLSSLAYIEGNYGLYPRIDKDLIMEHREGLICLSGSLRGEIPNLLLNVGESQAEKALKWYKDAFGDDFYLELNRHGIPEEDHLNKVLNRFSASYDIKTIAANELFYLNQEDAKAHDVLICIKENEKQSTPVGSGRGFRHGMINDQYFFKSQEEMKVLFHDLPEAIENISPLVSKIEHYELEREVLLPDFNIPESFLNPKDKSDGGKRGENAYLRDLTYKGAEKRYKKIDYSLRERIDFELETILKIGYPGYFLIVQDFTSKAREMGVAVGPGRGSAAGSVVAYCIGITNVDPIAYNLLFERFLNPDRVSLPDIDIDFDNEGREKVINYVVNKYGFNQVAQIITYGTMAPKSAIRDAGRVMELPLSETDKIARLIPERPGTNFKQALKEVPDLTAIKKGNDLPSQVLNQAVILEGSLRNTGIHACGVIITPKDMTNYIPMARARDSELLITQFDNSVVESAGMLKMDFLGLRTLSIIKTAVENIEKRHGIQIDIDLIPLDDKATYELYKKGATNGTFQFESLGMQKHLQALKPDKFEDLIAMNALYRPGPMEYIPNFINRKHGMEKIHYDLPDMEEYLAETYGITVYQEQVMLLSQKIGGFTKGEADVLRKAMGKKIFALLEELKPKFINQAKAKGYDQTSLEKIWKDWESFAAYAFNKSHSTCYSVVAYQTGYLKANYPAEYMAAVLTHNQNNIDKVTFFMEECRNQNIVVLGPDINESDEHFTVNSSGEIRFGLGAIKGTGEAAVQAIVAERKDKPFEDIFDFSVRINLRAVNKKSFEALAKAGGFDCFPAYHRRQYVEPDKDGISLIEKAISYANKVEQETLSSQRSLFGGSESKGLSKPKVGEVAPYGEIEKLNIEKDLVGLYISGHPLDQYQFEMRFLTKGKISDLKDLTLVNGRIFKIGGIITQVQHRMTKKGSPFGQFTFEDYSDSHTFFLFSDAYLKFKSYLEVGWFLSLSGSIQNRWKSEELEFKISNIEYLGDIREKAIKGLEIQVNLQAINDNLIEELEKLGEEFPGNCIIKLNIYNRHEDRLINVEMISRSVTIDPNYALIKKIESMVDLRYKVLLN